MAKAVSIDPDYLRELYINKRMSARRCAIALGHSHVAITQALIKYKIPARAFGIRKRHIVQKDILIDLYQKQHLTMEECAKSLGVSKSIVHSSLLMHEIPTRPPNSAPIYNISKEWLQENYVDDRKTLEECASMVGCTHHIIATALEKSGISQRPITSIELTHDWLFDNYVKQNKTLEECAYLAECSITPIKNKLNFFEISIRPACVPRYPPIGARNPNWKGGLKKQLYCYKFNNKLKEQIRDAFGRKCYLCPTLEADNGKRLDVHHADYNKGQGCGHEWNLLPLCIRCHAKTGHYRHYYFNLLSNYWCMNSEITFVCVVYPFDIQR